MKSHLGIEVPLEDIILNNNKEFVKLSGLIYVGHEHAKKLGGHLCFKSELIESNQGPEKNSLTKVTAYIQNGNGTILQSADGIAEANIHNTDELVHNFLASMCETRATCRALRFLTGISATAFEEIYDKRGARIEPSSPKEKTKSQPNKSNTEIDPELLDYHHSQLLSDIKIYVKELSLSKKDLLNLVASKLNIVVKTASDLTHEQLVSLRKELSDLSKSIPPSKPSKPSNSSDSKPINSEQPTKADKKEKLSTEVLSRMDILGKINQYRIDKKIESKEIMVLAKNFLIEYIPEALTETEIKEEIEHLKLLKEKLNTDDKPIKASDMSDKDLQSFFNYLDAEG